MGLETASLTSGLGSNVLCPPLGDDVHLEEFKADNPWGEQPHFPQSLLSRLCLIFIGNGQAAVLWW